MRGFTAALWAELLKLRRSRVPMYISLGYVALPVAMVFFMAIFRDPEWARQLGIIGAKAQIVVASFDWPTYLGMLAQGMMGFILLYALMASWVFGREHTDHTMKDLLALPTSRSALLAAKYIVIVVYSLLMMVLVSILGVALGYAVGLPAASTEVMLHGVATILVVGAMNLLLVAPMGLFACVGRGYLPPVGFTFLTLALAEISEVIGYAMYFPYAVPAIFIKWSAGGEPLPTVSYALVLLAGLIGVVGMYAWIRYADHT